jgi:hypothetical protein
MRCGSVRCVVVTFVNLFERMSVALFVVKLCALLFLPLDGQAPIEELG